MDWRDPDIATPWRSDPAEEDDELDEMSILLLVAMSELEAEWSAAGNGRAFDPAKHARIPKGQPGGGRFMSMVDRLKAALEQHGGPDPFEGFSREQLRRVAKARGIDLKRGEDRESIAQKLLAHLRGPAAADKASAHSEMPTLTGTDSRWWKSFTTDTGWEHPAPVKNLTLYSGEYTIEHGWAFRVNGVSYLIEGPGSASDAARQAQLLHHFHATLPAEAVRYQEAYHWLTGRNPTDSYWAEKYNHPDFRSAFTAGDGSTYAWGKVTGLNYDGSLRHEFGHNVSTAMRDQGLQAEGPAWQAATHGPNARRDVFDLTMDPGLAYDFKITPRFDPSAEFPYGVTMYGKNSITEDYAEATALYLHGRIGTGRLTKDGPVQPVYFRDLFPARAAILDRIYPSVAQAQLAQLRRLGR